MVLEGYIIFIYFYIQEIIIHGYKNQPFCKRQKAILQRFLMVFLMVSQDMSYSEKRQPFCRELMFSMVFSIFSRHPPFCKCIGCGCHSANSPSHSLLFPLGTGRFQWDHCCSSFQKAFICTKIASTLLAKKTLFFMLHK